MYPTAYKDTVTANVYLCTAVRKLLSEPRGLSTIYRTSYSQRYGFRLQNCKRATSMAYLMTAHRLILMGYINHTDCVWRVRNRRPVEDIMYSHPCIGLPVQSVFIHD